MHQRLLVLIGLFIGVASLTAAPVSLQQARQQARLFMAKRQAATGGWHQAPRQLSLTAVEQPAAARYYVFNANAGQGFVIVSADDRTDAVLGYSDSGSFDPQNIPVNMQEWLESCSSLIGQLETQGVSRQNAPRRAVRMPINPLVKSLWNQGTPYNNKTPVYQGQVLDHWDDSGNAVYRTGWIHCVTGCVATAMAQLMYYHKWPVGATTAIPAYTSSGGDKGDFNLSELPSTTFDWSRMYDTYTGTSSDTAEVSKLMVYCGQSVNMSYGTSSGATTSKVATALTTYFDYDQQIQIVDRSSYRYAEWVNLVYQELAAERPVLFSGQSIGGGHAFICDGYNEDDYFHINWGWGGMSNGYFKLSLLSPSEQGAGGSTTSDGYNLWQSIIVGIQPNTGYVPADPVVAMTISDISCEQTEVTRSSASSDFSGIGITAALYNRTGDTRSFDFALGLYQDEELKSVLASSSYDGLGHGWGFPEWNRTVSFGAGLPDGVYTIKAISREKDAEDWQQDYNADKYYVNATIAGNQLMLETVKPAQEIVDLKVNSVTFTGSKKANEEQQLVVNITNNGTLYIGDLTMTFNSYKAAGMQLEMEPGETRDVTFSFTPTVSGTNIGFNIIGGYFNYGSVIYSGTVDIAANSGSSASNDVELSLSADVVNKSSDSKYVYGTTLHIKATATNETDTDCNGSMAIQLYKWTRNGGGWSYSYAGLDKYSNFFAEAHSSAEVELSVEGLEEGGEYSIRVLYRKGNSWVAAGDHTEKTYIVKPGYNFYDADGKAAAAEATASLSVPSTITVIDLRGQNTIQNISQENPNTLFVLDEGQDVPAGITNAIIGTQAENIELADGYAFYTPFAFTADKISYKRTFGIGYKPGGYGWQTIFLPFAVERVTTDDGQSAIDWFRSPGDTDKQFWVMQFDGDNGSDEINFVQCAEFKPYIPYIIAVPGEEYPKYNLTGKTIVFSGSNAQVRANSDARTAITGNGFKMVGMQAATAQENIYALNDEGHSFVKGNYDLKSFGAYITATTTGQALARSLKMGFGSTSTGINSLPAAKAPAATGVYNLSGVRVADHLDRLPSGVYIVNGKKVVK